MPRPDLRIGHSAVWDAADGEMLIFGGYTNYPNGNIANDLWSYRPATNTWTQLNPSGTVPTVRAFQGAVWDPTNYQMLVFGGWIGNAQELNELWSYRPSTNTWVQLNPTGGPPSGRQSFSPVWDAANSQMLVFGGCAGCYSDFNDLWSYQPSTNNWILLTPAGTPPSPRDGFASAWDASNGQMLVFGGGCSQCSFAFNELWAYRP